MAALEADHGRLIILGGGIASLTTAFYASEPQHETVFPGGIHVYEQSDRLGGKGASGRASSRYVRHRIEEHGLHVWFGFYDNAFALLAKCHAYLEEQAARGSYTRWSSSLRSMEDGFRPCSRVAVMDHDGSRFLPWVADFPQDSTARPWDERQPGEQLGSASELAMRALRLAESLLYSLAGHGLGSEKPPPTLLDPALLPIPVRLPGIARLPQDIERFLRAARSSQTSSEQVSRVLALLARAASEVRNRLDETVRTHSGIRRMWYVLDMLLAAVRGLMDDGVLLTGNFELIDGYDLRAWLVLHGASEESVSSGLLKALVYDLAFAYEGGSPEKPSCSAATGVYGLLRLLLTYRGAIMWKMNAGMGEVVFAPIYEALLRRGVKFHFGHEVERVELETKAGRKSAKRISFKSKKEVPQPERLPTLMVESGPLAGTLPFWPGDERRGERSRRKPDPITLQPDDWIVYGMPVGTIRTLVRSAPERWKTCAEQVKTVATAALQLWLSAGVDRYASWASEDITVGAYTEPFDTWSDMKSLAGEAVGPRARVKQVGSVAYFTNVAPDGISDKVVKAEVASFLAQGLQPLWPSFERRMLLDRYVRLNRQPWARYTLSLPGTMAARLSPLDDTIRNMRPVGDWTRNSISAGCVEAAVISGMLAARVLRPDRLIAIFGEGT